MSFPLNNKRHILKKFKCPIKGLLPSSYNLEFIPKFLLSSSSKKKSLCLLCSQCDVYIQHYKNQRSFLAFFLVLTFWNDSLKKKK